jgi:hypothetical protein
MAHQAEQAPFPAAHLATSALIRGASGDVASGPNVCVDLAVAVITNCGKDCGLPRGMMRMRGVPVVSSSGTMPYFLNAASPRQHL